MKYLTIDEQIELLTDVSRQLLIARRDMETFSDRFDMVVANFDAFSAEYGRLDPANATRSAFVLEWQTEAMFWMTSVIQTYKIVIDHRDKLAAVRFTRDDKNVRDALQHMRKARRAMNDTYDHVLQEMAENHAKASSEVLLVVHANVFRAKVAVEK